MIRQAANNTIRRQATGRMTASTALARRSYASSPNSSSSSAKSPSGVPYAVGLLALAFGASAVLSQFPSDKARKAALQKLDTSHAAAATPAPVIKKAQEASSNLPPPAPATFTPPSPNEASVKGKDALKEQHLHAKEADAQAPGAQVHSEPVEATTESEADGQSAAFNPETGEINWDCPCLGGMADGPCGEEFKAAFSCFVYSEEEPKGVDCVEKFKGMQDCFRLHPEIYGAELADDEEPEEGSPMASAGSSSKSTPDTSIADLASQAEFALLGDSAFTDRDSDSPYTSSIHNSTDRADNVEKLKGSTVEKSKDKLNKA